MARQRVKNVIQLNSWNEVDEALRQIGENNRDLTAIENVMNEQIASAKANADAKARPLKEQTALLELAIETFTRKNRNDMGKAKSKILTFGKVSFRISTRVKIPTAKDKVAAIISQLRARGMNDCVTIPDPKIDKEALKKHSAEEIASVGAVLEVEDVFGYEVDSTALAK